MAAVASPYLIRPMALADIPQVSSAVDPVVQVLVLTDIVIEATVTGLLLPYGTRAVSPIYIICSCGS